ncbi:hypothetical protein GIY30_20320 [Gordonia sp. HNM0687]|uniref:Uncharacterized protein n=1 Tax=Gordonia mangrovi TaxID=2665643 RepID=A0A6L7GW42_9ACTN|nr:hypothetical protein [Gordonia mangrovi]MDY6810508.1 hypothetical protein [Actinomycetota bacterium]MXP23687.1 hypothetical protein [Gordonia mangrovi]UVF79747.1 hypothetical protein NWF22_07940 [Gordonia mangrovi]
MINNEFARGAQTFSRGMTIVGSAILLICVALLTINWWQEGRWVWVGLGIAIVVVNIGLIVLQFRRPKGPRPTSDTDSGPTA